jgi:hypothetical protein
MKELPRDLPPALRGNERLPLASDKLQKVCNLMKI